eukprot:TRINITY_DN907_c0_g1_i3.p1 TRINITY_DN907_c0_g1~~TRINITY_DN907_c0_g1_i3.p1  ORF type:complete len:413 (+),score=70.02 TRINITY_DN907_c0_g1_i3:65-1240(+)
MTRTRKAKMAPRQLPVTGRWHDMRDIAKQEPKTEMKHQTITKGKRSHICHRQASRPDKNKAWRGKGGLQNEIKQYMTRPIRRQWPKRMMSMHSPYVTKQFPLADSCLKTLIVGRKGEALKDLLKDFNHIRIKIPRAKYKSFVMLSGKAHNVTAVMKHLSRRLGCANVKPFKIPAGTLGVLLGKHGERKRFIERKFNYNIVVPNVPPGEPATGYVISKYKEHYHPEHSCKPSEVASFLTSMLAPTVLTSTKDVLCEEAKSSVFKPMKTVLESSDVSCSHFTVEPAADATFTGRLGVYGVKAFSVPPVNEQFQVTYRKALRADRVTRAPIKIGFKTPFPVRCVNIALPPHTCTAPRKLKVVFYKGPEVIGTVVAETVMEGCTCLCEVVGPSAT